MHPIYSVILFLILYVFGFIFTYTFIANEWMGPIVFMGLPLFSGVVTVVVSVVSHNFTRP